MLENVIKIITQIPWKLCYWMLLQALNYFSEESNTTIWSRELCSVCLLKERAKSDTTSLSIPCNFFTLLKFYGFSISNNINIKL